jgi:hypothetical protein
MLVDAGGKRFRRASSGGADPPLKNPHSAACSPAMLAIRSGAALSATNPAYH